MERKVNRVRNISSEKAGSEDGAMKPKTGSFQYKLLIFIIYGSGILSYVRRDRHIFEVWRRPLCIKFRKTVELINENFRKLEDEGYIYNVEIIGPNIRFCFNPPSWLAYSERESATRAKHPIANPAFTGKPDKIVAWNKKGDWK